MKYVLLFLFSGLFFAGCGFKEDKNKESDTATSTTKVVKSVDCDKKKRDENMTVKKTRYQTKYPFVKNGKIGEDFIQYLRESAKK